MTLKDIATLAIEEDAPFSKRTLRNAITHLANTGALKCIGTGKAGSPFKYYRLL